MKDVSSQLHGTDVDWIGVTTLTVLDRVGKTIGELLLCTKEVRLDKVNHGVVCV